MRFPFGRGPKGDPNECDPSHESPHPNADSPEHDDPQPPTPDMTTPHVTELPRQLEPICSDTFLGEREAAAPTPAPPPLHAVRDAGPLAVVLQLRPRDPQAARRPAKPRRRARRPPHSGPGLGSGPGGDAA